jgi:hypothetical protein
VIVIGEEHGWFVAEVRRLRPWRVEATVWIYRSEGETGAHPLVTVRALTRLGARRRAARFIELRERLAERNA